MALEKFRIKHDEKKEMLNRFSIDITKGIAAVAGINSKIFFKIFSSLPFHVGTVNTPKNVIKNDDFYRADFIFFYKPSGKKFLTCCYENEIEMLKITQRNIRVRTFYDH